MDLAVNWTGGSQRRFAAGCYRSRRWPAPARTSALALPAAAAQGLSNLLPILLCGEESAELAFTDAAEAVSGVLLSRVREILQGIAEDEFRKTWKLVANQSERQLGAFVFLYLAKNGKSVKYLTDKAINFRNKVIHKGYIPTLDETSDYGHEVLSFIDPILDDLKYNHSNAVNDLLHREITKFPALTNSFQFPTIINYSYQPGFSTQRDFRTEMETLRKKIKRLTAGELNYGIFSKS